MHYLVGGEGIEIAMKKKKKRCECIHVGWKERIVAAFFLGRLLSNKQTIINETN
jgi:hypothetical protein